jgi:hypothetical protein
MICLDVWEGAWVPFSSGMMKMTDLPYYARLWKGRKSHCDIWP